MSDHTPSHVSTTHRMARNTLILMIAFAVSKLISLAQTVIIADVFGVGDEWDAFVTANRIPEQIVLLIGGGALSYAFIPVFSGLLARGDRANAWKLASEVLNTVFTVTLTLSVVGFFLAPWLVQNVAAPGFDAQKAAQTANLMRILLLSTMIFSISGLFQGILHSHNHFLLPALAPILFDVGLLFGVAFLIKPLGVYGIAWGAVLGALLHLGVQVPGLVHYRMRWRPILGWRDPTLRRVIVLMLPRVAGLGVVGFNALVFNNVASRMGSGAVSAFDWGYRLMNIPETLIGSAMGFVVFPTLAAFSELGDVARKRRAMVGALRFILIATIPSAVGLVLIGHALISLLERGAFDARDSVLVYGTLQFFAFGLVFQSLHEVIARSFYADKDTFTPLWTALVAAAVNVLVVGGVYWGWRAHYGQGEVHAGVLGIGGLALGYSTTFFVELTLLLAILRKRWGGIHEQELAQTALRTLGATAVMGVAVLATDSALGAAGFHNAGVARTVLRVLVLTSVGAGTFAAAGLALGLREIRTLPTLLLRREREHPALAD